MNTLDKKEIDTNDYWLISDNPITKIGIFPYLGRQISPDLEPDTVYQVLRPEEELTKPETLKSFELIPIVDDHTMLGDKDENHVPAEQKGIHGVTGTNVKRKGDLITVDLKIFSETLKDEIEGGKKDLSLGYYSSYELTKGLYKGQAYDAIQRNIIANHIALVDEGRMGHDVRVMDGNITFDSITPIKNTGEQTNMENQKEKQAAQDIDKREIIREVMAIAAKPIEEFEGGEEEKIETIAKKLEEIAYKPSEAGANDEDDTDKPVEAGIKEDKPAEDEDKDDKPAEDEEQDEEKKDDEKNPVSMDSAIKYIAKRDSLVSRIKPIIGDNAEYPAMSIKEVVKYACDKLDLKPSLDALEGYIKAHTKAQAKITLAQDGMITSYDKKSQVIKDYLK